MRYPLNAHRKELAAAEGAREREKELAKEIQDAGDLDDEDDGEFWYQAWLLLSFYGESHAQKIGML